MGRAFVSTKRIAKGTVILDCQATGNSVVLLDHLVGERCDVCLADTATKPCGNKSCAAVLCATCRRSTQHASVCGAASREPVLVRSLLRLAAAERADGAVARQLDALENHHDAYGPERRDAFKAAAARAAAYCGGDARRLARHAAAFESNEFGVSEPNRWRHAPLELGEESVGCGLFAAAAPANHSCAPNCDPFVVIEAGRAPVLRLSRARRSRRASRSSSRTCRSTRRARSAGRPCETRTFSIAPARAAGRNGGTALRPPRCSAQ